MNIDPSLRHFAAPRWSAWRVVTAAVLLLHWASPSVPRLLRAGDGVPSFQTDTRGTQLGAFRRAVPAIVKLENTHAQSAPKQWSGHDQSDALVPIIGSAAPRALLAADAVRTPALRTVFSRAFDPRAPPA
jgi:hypothetical protein